MTEKQAKDLKKSIEKFNFVELPVVNTDRIIVAGHQRLKIMQMLGRGDEEIEVRIPNRELTKDEVTEYCLRSNKNTGEWNFDLLSGFDESLLKEIGFTDFDLSIAGFGEEENTKNGRLEYYHKEIECPFCHKKFKRKVNDV